MSSAELASHTVVSECRLYVQIDVCSRSRQDLLFKVISFIICENRGADISMCFQNLAAELTHQMLRAADRCLFWKRGALLTTVWRIPHGGTSFSLTTSHSLDMNTTCLCLYLAGCLDDVHRLVWVFCRWQGCPSLQSPHSEEELLLTPWGVVVCHKRAEVKTEVCAVHYLCSIL